MQGVVGTNFGERWYVWSELMPGRHCRDLDCALKAVKLLQNLVLVVLSQFYNNCTQDGQGLNLQRVA